MGAAASISAPEEKKTLLAKCVEEYEAEAAKDGAQTDAILDTLADKYTDIIQHVDESKWPEFSAWLAKDRQLCMPCEAIGSVPRLQAVARMAPQPDVQIRGDQSAQYDSVGRVLLECQRAGISKVAFITEPAARGG
jgi:hypothetical protein